MVFHETMSIVKCAFAAISDSGHLGFKIALHAAKKTRISDWLRHSILSISWKITFIRYKFSIYMILSIDILFTFSACPDRPTPCTKENFFSPDPNPQKLYGALVRGPNGDETYTDDRTNTENEVAPGANSGFQSAVAYLYKLHLQNKLPQEVYGCRISETDVFDVYIDVSGASFVNVFNYNLLCLSVYFSFYLHLNFF